MNVPKVDKSMSASGKYGEPSASSVVLPDPPAWLNLNEIISYDEREEIKDLVEEGREFLPGLAVWCKSVRALMAKFEEGVPAMVWEFPEIQECLGLTALSNVRSVIGKLGGNPAGTPTGEALVRMREEYQQYAALLRDDS